jgi:hypothetical protein
MKNEKSPMFMRLRTDVRMKTPKGGGGALPHFAHHFVDHFVQHFVPPFVASLDSSPRPSYQSLTLSNGQ